MKKSLALLLAALMLCGTVTTGLAADAAESETLDYVQGDIDGDGEVIISDAVLLFRNSMTPDLYPVSYAGSMDFTLDEKVDIYDALRLFQYSMLPEEYPLFLSYNLTEDGEAKSHIVLFDGANAVEQTVAADFVYHIKLVSGADVPVTNTIGEDSLPIIIATPDSYPELENLFPEDLAWLRTLTEETEDGVRNWGDDGFAIRALDDKIYIFGATAKGAMNGAYDFIEENMGVLWPRSDPNYSIIYDEDPTISATKLNYREKSPFQVRGWHFAGYSDQYYASDYMARNKMNSYSSISVPEKGIIKFGVTHNIKDLVYNSPIYDPECTEYWNTDGYGNPLTYEDSMQINFWSDKAAEAVAASIIAYVKDGVDFPLMCAGEMGVFIGMQDVSTGYCLPYSKQPFEYAPGQFVEPKNSGAFYSTVCFTFINKVARMVDAECPGTNIVTFAYSFTKKAPLVELEDNVTIVFAPLDEDFTASLFDSSNRANKAVLNNLKGWAETTDRLYFYNYYGCCTAGNVYSRPIWDRIQEHLQYYTECGFQGIQPEGVSDNFIPGVAYTGMEEDTYSNVWHMNSMIYWIYAKLTWNPYDDVDALIVEFCDKYYGEASEYMQEYYRLIKQGWDEGADDIQRFYDWAFPVEEYISAFLLNPTFEEGFYDRILEALNNAWDAANDAEKERIRYIKEIMEDMADGTLDRGKTPEESEAVTE